MNTAETIHIALRALVLLLACPTGAQTTVDLRHTARPEHAAITVADLADVRGELAHAVAQVPLKLPRADTSGWTTLDAIDVRAAVTDALGEAAALIAIRGGPTSVLVAAPSSATLAAPAAQPAPAEPDVVDGAALAAEPTVRGRVVLALARALSVSPTDLRVELDPRDADLLAMPAAGRVIDAQPTGMGARIPVAVKVFESDRVIASGTVRTRAEVRRVVAVAARDIERGQRVGPADIAPTLRWLPPDADAVSPEHAIGQQARASVRTGEVLAGRNVEQPLVIRRGELTTVSVISPTFVVEVIARATADATDGQTIEFESLDNRSRTFTARATGRGRAAASTQENR